MLTDLYSFNKGGVDTLKQTQKQTKTQTASPKNNWKSEIRFILLCLC